MSNSLEERLKTHSTAFDGLLSLIPAKYYYDNATQDQWKEKKKTKEELKANKRQKLDPTSVKNLQNGSAKDILKQRELDAKPVVIPGAAAAAAAATATRAAAALNSEIAHNDDTEASEAEEDDDDVPEVNPSELEDGSESDSEQDQDQEEEVDFMNNANSLVFDDEGNELNRQQETQQEEIKKQQKLQQQQEAQKKKLSGKKQSTPEEQKERKERLALLREKVTNKITALKEKRKAPGTKVPGAPSSRQHILEQRKLKAEQQQQKKRKLDEEEESEDSDSEDSDSDVEPEQEQNQVLYGNIVFNDGDKLTSDLSALRKSKSKKGPSNNDIKGHLAKLTAQKAKLSEMDSDKKIEFEEKNKWNRLISNIEGVKLKDDEKLLKKALKRKEKSKMKSEREWRERKDTVDATIAARQKRREENLQQRKENKGKRSKHQTKLKKKFTGIVNKRTNGKSKKDGNANGNGNASGGAGDKKKQRAGFEGRMKSSKKK